MVNIEIAVDVNFLFDRLETRKEKGFSKTEEHSKQSLQSSSIRVGKRRLHNSNIT